MTISICTLSRIAAPNTPDAEHRDWRRWRRDIRVEYDWSDATESGIDRVWDAARMEYQRQVPICPSDQILEIRRR